VTETAPADQVDLTADDLEKLALMDEAHLLSFTDGDKELELELAELFVSTALGYIRRMEEAIKEERSWSAEVHALKGASANLGAIRLAALAKRLEFAPPSKEDLNSLRATFEETKAFLLDKR